MSSIENKYPRFRKFARKTAQIIWWTATGQLIEKTRSNKLAIFDQPHFSPLFADHALEVPLQYNPGIPERTPKLAVICHMYYEHLIDEFKQYVLNIPFNFDLYISTDTDEKKIFILNALKDWKKGKTEIRITPNRGRDIAPKLIVFKEIHNWYDYVLHLHSKISPYGSSLEGWRIYLLQTLLGSSSVVNSVFEIFNKNPNIGIISCQHFEAVRPALGWGYNFKIAKKLAKRLNIKVDIHQYLDFPSGSMFWARTKALKPLLDAGLTFDDFPKEYKQEDGTIAHAIERMYFHACEKAGFDWIKIGKKDLLKSTRNRLIQVKNFNELTDYFNSHTIRILNHKNAQFKEKAIYHAYLNSDYHGQLTLNEFTEEITKLSKGMPGKIDFDEAFYKSMHQDIAHLIDQKAYPAGYIHYCLFGKAEGRIWSTNEIKTRFGISPQTGQGFLTPSLAKPYREEIFDLSYRERSADSWLLIIFSYLQADLFFAGYSEFFRDFKPVFNLFDRVTIAIDSPTFDAAIATAYLSTIEVIHISQLPAIYLKPHVIVAFNHRLFYKAVQIYNDLNRTVYYCQEHEAGFFPFGTDYILAEQAVAKSKNLVISTTLLKEYFAAKQLLSNESHIFITSPKIIPYTVSQGKSKKLFFYFRPESFQSRNLAPMIYSTVAEFCNQHTGYEIYMVGTIATAYSYTQNENKIFISNKLPQDKYIDLISGCDLVISLIYSAHPGVIAYQAAASGIPTITNIFENRSASVLKAISSNLIPFDPVRDDLLDLVQSSLDLPKGNKSFDESIYGKKNDQKLENYIKNIMNME